MSTPEIVLGRVAADDCSSRRSSCRSRRACVFPLSIRTILIAHIMFNISFVVVTVKARLAGFPRHLEEAAMDLGRERVDDLLEGDVPAHPAGHHGRGAARVQPVDRRLRHHELHRPARPQTFPLFIYGSQLRGIPVQVNVIGTIIFVSAVALVLLTTLWQRRVAARDYAPAECIDRPRSESAQITRRRDGALPCPTTASSRPSGAGSRTSTSTAARDRGSSPATASATSTTRRGSASPTPATPIRASRRRSRRRPASCSTASRTSCTTSPACGSTTASRDLLPGGP